MSDFLEIPAEADLSPDAQLSDVQGAVLDAIWKLTAGIGGAWCDGRAILSLAGRYSATPRHHLVVRGLIERSWPKAQPSRPHSRHSWPPTALYRFTQEGFVEYSAARGVFA